MHALEVTLRIGWTSCLFSIVIIGCGWIGSQTLSHVDQDLRTIYAEYTMAAADLGHVNGELIRYRTTVLRAIEAETKADFVRIAASLPNVHSRIDKAIQRFVDATNDASPGKNMDARELEELKNVQQRLTAYIDSSHYTIELLKNRWEAKSANEASRLRKAAEEHAAKDAGRKLIGVTLELDRLLEVVAEIAGEVRKEADVSLRIATMEFMVTSVLLAALVLILPVRRSG
ncbi:MCP four helix bundle domain-containing protein [Nitrospira japonica]|nr:MCP four helix bundle domain-containing protein [Nitrospira japonica]